ncbi:amino acid kinase family protein [Tautonia marina]|uniref:amino acid kinase family protein n=1 Tax=Tautonia marina TaxID=2653855 RepID=UPI001260C33C|nr:uridylate kinase [Tautonia marina]
MPPPLLVAKVGGSLLNWSGLPDALTAFLDRKRARRLVLVVGGGETVDVIRSLDQTHSLGERASHHLALRAMDLTSHCLAAIVPGLVVVETIAELPPLWNGHLVPVFAPRRFLDQEDQSVSDPLPHSWSVTSDSIAARLADRLGADSLVLLKSTDAPASIDRSEAASLGLVDPSFPAVSLPIPRVSILNLRDARLQETELP